ncbi:Nicotianamine aminotransferase [Heracleum sosnowskyi]|uniref:Nicotianamine aminotransferase n=1 Tax=Heracleum sosnowskyi TaxID=360622 RepID=A0AAD8IRV0_9APIA|nr:Nicotianamine aminotransferase [Heracleum sosnowskyi]
MEQDSAVSWNFRGSEKVKESCTHSISRLVVEVMKNVIARDKIIHLGIGDPSSVPCFRTAFAAEDAIISALRSATFNGSSPTSGLPQARSSIAEYLSQDLPDKLSADDIYVTVGARQAIEVVLTVLARPGANILLPRPWYPLYEAFVAFTGLEARHFDLLPENGWQVDLDAVKNIADDNTVAMVIINPGNPCGNVFTHEHLKNIAETAEKLGILVMADESYGHLAYGSTPFTPMGVFGSVVPVITVGSLSKRWFVPGWRLGWIAISDPTSILQGSKIVESIKGNIAICSDPTTFTQGAVPQILENTAGEFYSKTASILREDAEICYDLIKQIPCIACPHKPDGSMFVMVKLHISQLENIKDDMEFCTMLAKEESVIVLPGFILGLKNWLRITYAQEPSTLKDGLGRMKAFCLRHARKMQG